MTRNITLAIDETVLKRVRRIAAERETTVNALVRDYLTRLADFEDRAANARQQLVELARQSSWDPGPDWTWDRDAIHDRQALRRHEHSRLRGADEGERGKKETSSDGADRS